MAPPTLLLAHRGLCRAFRTPAYLFVIAALPPLLLWGAVQFLGSLPQNLRFPTRDYLSFVGPGMCVAGPIPGAVLCGAYLQADRRSGMLDGLVTAPIARASMVLGAMLSAMIGAVVSCAIVLLAALLDGMSLGAGLVALPALLGLAALVSIPFCACALVAATLIRRPSSLALLCGSLALGAGLLSQLLLPAALLPDWLTALGRLNPLTYGLEGARALAAPSADWQLVGRDLLLLAMVAICACSVALAAFERAVEAG